MNKNIQGIIKRFSMLLVRSLLLFGAYFLASEMSFHISNFVADSMSFLFICELISNIPLTIAFTLIWGKWEYVRNRFWGIIFKNIFPSLFVSFLAFFNIHLGVFSYNVGIDLFSLMVWLTMMYIFLSVIFLTWNITLKKLPARCFISLAKKAYEAGKEEIISAKYGISCQFIGSDGDPSKEENYVLQWKFSKSGENPVEMFFNFIWKQEQGKKVFYPTIGKHGCDFPSQRKKIQKMGKKLTAHFLPSE